MREDEPDQGKKVKIRMSIRTKILLVIMAALLLFGVAAMAGTYQVFMSASVDQHKRMAEGAVKLLSGCIDPEKVDLYLEKGEAAPGYLDTKLQLDGIRKSYLDIKYVYVYKIMEDGCHVVFDLDTEDMKGAAPGDVVPFDESFDFHLPILLEGKPIDPVISESNFGWLLTVYNPIYDKTGKCRCYVAVDISMEDLSNKTDDLIKQLFMVYLTILVVLLPLIYHYAKTQIIEPINIMAHATDAIVYSNASVMAKGLEGIRHLNIRTGDEIENLYRTFVQMIEDSVRYMTDIRRKNETISQMQHALILTLADMVEKRDQNTGQHIRKTAAYVGVIMAAMKVKGIHADELTDDFMENVVNSAPLHDLGKINVPDAILNKPGRLTQEEFATMQSHTRAGEEILSSIIKSVPMAGYLYEARNLAAYHHEKWDGTGYPQGLKGEEIPLSARIMAVADVFDALISNRSYKKGFSYEKAFEIIREESGTHFDPGVVEAFFSAQEEILLIADEFKEGEEEF